MVLYLSVTAKQQAVEQKLKNFFTKWRQVQQKIPLPEMTELLITPQLPEYPKIAEEVFMLLLDGKLRSRTEILKFLKPLAPPPPPPPPPPRRGRGAKAAAAPVAVPPAAAKKKGKGAAVPVVPVPPIPAAKPPPAKPATGKPTVINTGPCKPARPVKPPAKPMKKAAPKTLTPNKPPEKRRT